MYQIVGAARWSSLTWEDGTGVDPLYNGQISVFLNSLFIGKPQKLMTLQYLGKMAVLMIIPDQIFCVTIAVVRTTVLLGYISPHHIASGPFPS